mmetsp:Transcript_23027/g.61144  ORF Transcript_23027/g.61144 Transcript_23027/m.61144 type:complete len:153 (-) Transcript_23027:95-553(-)
MPLPYEEKQAAFDKVDDEGGTPMAVTHHQMALCFCARFGTIGVKFGMLILGAIPSGATESKNHDDPWYGQIINGSESTVARATARGQRKTVLFLLDSAPAMRLGGDFWRANGRNIADRQALREWCLNDPGPPENANCIRKVGRRCVCGGLDH